MCQRSSDGSPSTIHSAITLPTPPAPASPCAQNPAATNRPAHRRLAEAELAVGRERLRPVDQPRHLHVLHRRHALARVDDDLLEAVPVVLEQAAVEVGRDLVQAAAAVAQRPRRGVALVAAHHQPAALLAEVDQQVGIAHRRQGLVTALAEGLRDEVLVRERDHGDAHAGEPADLRREHAARVDDDVGLDVAAVRAHALDAAAVHVDPGDARAREGPAAAPPRAVGQGEGELRRVEVAVGRQPRGAEHAVGHHQREALGRLLGGDQLEREPERLGPAGLAPGLLQPLRGAGEPDAAALGPARVELSPAQLPVQLDRVHHHLRERHRRAQLADQAGRVEGRAAGELRAVEQHDVAPAELGEVVGDRGPRHAAADDHAARARGKVTADRHGHPPARFGSARRPGRPPRARGAAPRRRRSRSPARRWRSGRRPTSPRGSRT